MGCVEGGDQHSNGEVDPVESCCRGGGGGEDWKWNMEKEKIMNDNEEDEAIRHFNAQADDTDPRT